MTCDLLRLQPECDVTSVGRASTAMSSLANTMLAPVKAAAAVGETKFDNVKVMQCAALMSRVSAQRRSNCESHTFECHFVDFEQGEWWQLPLSDAVTQVRSHMQLQLPRASHCDTGFVRPEQPRVHVHRALLRLQVRVPCHALRS